MKRTTTVGLGGKADDSDQAGRPDHAQFSTSPRQLQQNGRRW